MLEDPFFGSSRQISKVDLAGRNSEALKTSRYPVYFRRLLNDSDDLNSLNQPLQSGFYWQGANLNATAERHYPFTESGVLEILPCVGSNNAILQRYTGFRTCKIATRIYRDGSWTDDGVWQIITPDSSKSFA